jgi:AcrR family transcriptional regulator
MPPRQTPKSEATQVRILESALALFQSQGFDKTTMRQIAEASGMALGAAYYYFKTKEELVLHFYAETGAEARAQNREIVAASRDFQQRMSALLHFKLDQMSPFRDLAAVLARQAGEWNHPLSPFSPHTKPMRDEAIGLIEEVLEGSNLKAASTIRPYLARILWLYQMGIILFWVNDASPDQKRTGELITVSLGLVQRLIHTTALPFMGGINQAAVRIVEMVQGPPPESGQHP